MVEKYLAALCLLVLSSCAAPQQANPKPVQLVGVVRQVQYKESVLHGDYWKATIDLNDGRRIVAQNEGLDYEALNEQVLEGDCVSVSTIYSKNNKVDVGIEDVKVVSTDQCEKTN